MNVTTKKGDGGTTTLFNRAGIAKHDPRIALIGENDEVQALLGMLKTTLPKKTMRHYITQLQESIYHIMGELSHAKSVPQTTLAQWTNELEEQEQALMKKTKIKNAFVIPGANQPEAWCQITRTAVRRLERSYSAHAQTHPEMRKFIPFFNRLSDYLFVLGQSLV